MDSIYSPLQKIKSIDCYLYLLILLPATTNFCHWVILRTQFLFLTIHLHTRQGLYIQNKHRFHHLAVKCLLDEWKKMNRHLDNQIEHNLELIYDEDNNIGEVKLAELDE